MFDMHRVELDWGGRKLTLETGRVARQADGAVLATYGETTVLAAVVAAKEPKEGIDFLPLTVNYTEKYYAAGRIPGGYFKRERGPTEKDTLTSRLIDRLVDEGLASRRECKIDKRGQFVEITEAGRELQRKMWGAYSAAIEKHVGSKLSDVDALKLCGLLDRLGCSCGDVKAAAAAKEGAPAR